MTLSSLLVLVKTLLIGLDKRIRSSLDWILPRNLTVRYIAALSAIGILAVLGQIVMQLSLTRLEIDQKKIRMIEMKIRDSESLRKATFGLQLSANKIEMKRQLEVIYKWLNQLEMDPVLLTSEDSLEKFKFDSPINLSEQIVSEKKAILGIVQNYRLLHSIITDDVLPQVSITANQLGTVIQDFISNELLYEDTLRKIVHYYERRIIHQTNDAHKWELCFLLAILSLLLVQGLYVFRPGVESLYDALRTRSEFLGRMGHEIRNPMNSIIGMTNLLFETPLTDQQRKYLSIVRKSSGGLLDILNSLLDFSTVESKRIKLERISFNLCELMERSIDLAVFGAHSFEIELILDLGSDVPLKLIGDPSRLQQVISNLLGNAVKFTKKGEVTLQVKLVKMSEEAFIQFAILDTGMGIDKKKVRRIFDPFVQEDSSVRRRFGGAGLGLSIASDLVKLMGGVLAVESEKNVGSRFHFTVPFALDQKPEKNDTIEHLIQSQKFGQFKALILEPNLRLLEILEGWVQSMGGFTSCFNAEMEVQRIFSGCREIPDTQGTVFIVDYEFVKSSLLDLFSKVRRVEMDFSSFIFLVKTTASSSELEQLAEHGVKNFLFKPVKPTQFIELMSYAITGEKEARVAILSEELVHDSRSLRILAADDSKDNQFLVKAYLESLPYRIVFADNGAIALQKFKESRVDLILMDLQMPEMDGYSAVEEIRKWETLQGFPSIPIIAVTAHNHEYESKRFQDAGFSGYLLKPINPNQLRKAILRLTSESESKPSSKKVMDAYSRSTIAHIEKRLAEMAPSYIRSRKEDLNNLKIFIESSDFQNIAMLGHRIKGSAKIYGFEELGKLGGVLETAANERNLEHTRITVGSIEEFLMKVN